MPAATAHGYPYPLGTDRVMDGDDSIKALADKVEARLTGGVWSNNGVATAVGASAAKSVVVTFPVGLFPTMPNVVASPWDSTPQLRHVAPSGITAASVTLVCANGAGAAADIYYTLIAHLP